jgi:hypothetical protein
MMLCHDDFASKMTNCDVGQCFTEVGEELECLITIRGCADKLDDITDALCRRDRLTVTRDVRRGAKPSPRGRPLSGV